MESNICAIKVLTSDVWQVIRDHLENDMVMVVRQVATCFRDCWSNKVCKNGDDRSVVPVGGIRPLFRRLHLLFLDEGFVVRGNFCGETRDYFRVILKVRLPDRWINKTSGVKPNDFMKIKEFLLACGERERDIHSGRVKRIFCFKPSSNILLICEDLSGHSKDYIGRLVGEPVVKRNLYLREKVLHRNLSRRFWLCNYGDSWSGIEENGALLMLDW